MKRGRYVPNVARLGALAEANYQRLMRLLRSGRDGVVRLSLARGNDYFGDVRITRTEQGRYTETFYLEQTATGGRWLNNPRLTVRVYHDARMSEVVACWRQARAALIGDYPNHGMNHPDEKTLANEFLADWLNFCLRFGHSQEPLCFAAP